MLLPECGEVIPVSCSIYQKNSLTNYFYTDMKGQSAKQKSDTMLIRLLENLYFICERKKIKFVYFDSHNKITAFLLLRAIVACNYDFKPLIREGMLYEIQILKRGRKQKSILFILRDYRRLLEAPLEILYKDFVDNKKNIPSHEIINEDENKKFTPDCKDLYIKHTITRAKARRNEILLKTQQIIFTEFSCDITQSMTISALAMRVFTSHFYKDTIFTNTEFELRSFIRCAYFGGHVDLYRPIAENAYVYDINSLYPYCMRLDMPSGKPDWIPCCKGLALENLFGFIEADIICPKTIERPFLPMRHKGKLYFPTGKWRGTYFSEELKFAKKLGYSIELKKAMLFKKNKSPLTEFIDTFYTLRVKAKKENKKASQTIYKLILLSLYGRLGMRPDFSITVVGPKD